MWETIIPAAGAVFGGLAGGGGTEKIQAMEAIPRFLRDDYERLAGGIEGLQTPEYYQGQLIADINPYMSGALSGMGGWGSGMGGDLMNAMYGGGMLGLDAMGQGLDYANMLQQRGPNQFQYDQGTYDQAFGNLTGGLQQFFDNGALRMNQDYAYNQLPGLNMGAALSSGGGGGTKAGQQFAIGDAMRQQNLLDFGSNLWMNAANQANANAMTGGVQNLATANAFDQNLLNTYGRYGQMGSDMLRGAYDMGVGNLNLGYKAGQWQQGYDQSLIDAQMKKHNFEQQAPWIALQTKLGMMPSPGGVQQGTPGLTAWEGALQGLQTGIDIYGAGKEGGIWD